MKRTVNGWRGVAPVGLVLMGSWVASSGCNIQRGWPDRAAGALGYAQVCEDDGSDICTPAATDFAVASTFSLRAELSEDLPGEIKEQGLASASREYLEVQAAGLVALQEGDVALLVMGTREVIDYVMLRLHDVDEIVLTAPERLPVGEPITVIANPFGDGVALAGRLDYTWVSRSEGLVIVDGSSGPVADLRLETPNQVTLEVSAGGHTEVISLDPYPGPSRMRPPQPPPPSLPPGPGGLGPQTRPPGQGGAR